MFIQSRIYKIIKQIFVICRKIEIYFTGNNNNNNNQPHQQTNKQTNIEKIPTISKTFLD